MGLMDKVRDQATHIAGKAQEGVATAQEKLNESQVKHRKDALYSKLGELVYNHNRGQSSGDYDSELNSLFEEIDKI